MWTAWILLRMRSCKIKLKGKFEPKTGHEGPEKD